MSNNASYEVEPIILNTDNLRAPEPVSGIWENRAEAYKMYDDPGVPQCSIMVTGFNRLEKTKYCVECILKYTKDVRYELILIDNGSEDGTYNYFQSVPYENKQIIKVTHNIGVSFPQKHVLQIFKGKYLVGVSNDVYVTKNWLSNLLKCYESDQKIGMVVPVSSNVSNLQQIDLNYKSHDDMQKKAAAYNVSDSAKWEERLRLVTVITVWTRQILDMVGIPDSAFIHDFSEDDMCARIRRNGYKLMLCRDTWICHDHDIWNMEDKEPEAFQASLDSGRVSYREKYKGIDAWDDILNFELSLFDLMKSVQFTDEQIRSLVIDGRCGTPVLEIRNHLRRRGKHNVQSYAFTTHAKYFLDLQTVSEDVKCDRIDFIQNYYVNHMFEIVTLCEPINIYPSPIRLLQKLYDFLSPKGVLLFKLRNTDDYRAFLRSAGLGDTSDDDLPAVLPLNQVEECVKLFGGRNISVVAEYENLSIGDQNTLLSILKTVKHDANNNDLKRLITKEYLFRVIKG